MLMMMISCSNLFFIPCYCCERKNRFIADPTPRWIGCYVILVWFSIVAAIIDWVWKAGGGVGMGGHVGGVGKVRCTSSQLVAYSVDSGQHG